MLAFPASKYETSSMDCISVELFCAYYRLVLYGGSHNEERVKSMISEDFFDYISSDEKKRTAKEILCFLYLLDERHALEHLKKILMEKSCQMCKKI